MRATSRFLFLILLLFAASGCSALVYEVVWYQALQLAIGSTSVSLGILLATFMGGLCIGSLAFPRVSLSRHPLRIYAGLEVGIACCAILVDRGLPYLNRVYFTGAEHGLPGMLLRGALAACCLLLPTILMGASLPALVRWIENAGSGVSWWGYLYGGNTAGAVFGCLFAGFYLLPKFNMPVATWVAAVINLVVAAISFTAAARFEWRDSGLQNSHAAPPEAALTRWPVYLTIAVSGATALGAEVVWTRLMGILLLGTVYAFSLILAVFLTGLAFGSAAGSWILRRIKPRLALGWSQILIAVAIAWTAYAITQALPFWKDSVLTTQNTWQLYWLDLKRCLFAILPATLFWGASFPLACAAAAKNEDPARTAGRIYAANTLGAIAGALIVSLVLIPAIGSQNSQRVLLVLSAAAGILMLGLSLAPSWRNTVTLSAAAIAAIFLARGVGPIPGELIAYGRRMASYAGYSKILYMREGINSSVAYSEWNDGTIYINVNGHVEATTEPYDMKLQRMVGHLPALLHPQAQSVLGIGFGAGVTAGTFTRYLNIRKITICEIEPVIPPASTRFFGPQDYKVALDPRTHIVFDDARHYLLTTPEKFDIIASDPLDVFIKGTAALYSKEYFEAVKQHLKPGGKFSLYVPLYETDEPTIKSELATFFAAFPYGTIWANTREGLGYDMVFMAELEPPKIDIDQVQQRLDRPDYAPVRESLQEIGVTRAVDLFATYTGNANSLRPWITGSPINTDRDLRLSYLAGWAINAGVEDYLYRRMLDYRRSPLGIFTGSPGTMNALQAALFAQ